MTYKVLFIAIVASTFGVTHANAKLIDAIPSELDEASHRALHKPTGCQARVVLRGKIFLKAQITDPNCLPAGITARNIPGTLFDFLVTPK